MFILSLIFTWILNFLHLISVNSTIVKLGSIQNGFWFTLVAAYIGYNKVKGKATYLFYVYFNFVVFVGSI